MSGKRIIEGAKQAVAVARGKAPAKLTSYSMLDQKKHGVGGLIRGKIKEKKQDRRAVSDDLYAVVFFPKIHGIGPAHVGLHDMTTLAQSAAAAKMKFMDRIKQGEKWASYARAGWRVRKVTIRDLGDAA